MAVRRSARLRNRQASNEPQPPASPVNNTTTDTNNNNKLPSVMERDETPADVPSNHTTTTTTTTTPKSTTNVRTPHKATPAQKQTPAKTPTSAVTRPSHQEMHPSKVHQSTTKQADSGLILGFNPIKKDAEGNVMKDSLVETTPSKTKASPASTYYGTPAFEFKFSSADSQLSDEAKRLMESVREDVARIKAQMVQEKESQPDQDSNNQTENRKIAEPKGQASRFNAAHMAEFKKMDSIAGHASAFRATPGRFQPVRKDLKRTRLDESNQNSPTKSTTKSPAPATVGAKRVKHDKSDDTSTRRQTVGEKSASKPAVTRTRPAIRSSLMTPTRASMARTSSTSLRPPRTSMLPRPSLAHSPTSKQSNTPRTPNTDFNPRFKSGLPQLNLKSILRPHQPLFSKDPAKIAAGTHVAAPEFSSKFLLGTTRDASEEPAVTPSPKKRVEFSSSTRLQDDEAQPSPSPSKFTTGSPSRVASDIVYPTLPALTPDHASKKSDSETKSPTIRHVRQSDAPTNLSLPDISGVPHGIGSKKRHRETEATHDPSLPDVPGVPHGIGNKKRHRDAAGRDVDTENVPPADAAAENRSAKRVKLSSPSKLSPFKFSPSKMPTPSPTKARSHTPLRPTTSASRTGTPASARQKSRNALTMSRLNALAQPKNRS
ncbi:Cortical protein KAR9 [Aspergillus parasiticus SU-1]|uniref:Cortical protein KAR9 n=1 Tax=Aspergillus parasiticus (strain ATCC 56775 / NRRL 5862 / SRRC 143 / SU-1) TaxID=1403190 RepID=A0A0F0I711_ASPPU|nr:Cortical protein KAR9 [Aspergillus parasiticus SU-1]